MTENLYTNNLRSIKRVMSERKSIHDEKDELAKEGLYFYFDEEKIDSHYKFMIVGPPDSCYTGGFYFFQCQFPDSYPFHPMKIKSCTQGGNIRKHPNLYICGKCCFSFLGTWSGPPWSSLQTSKSVAFSIRSVLTDNPLQNEPAFEKGKLTDPRHKDYANLVIYFNIRYATIEMLSKTPKEFQMFLPDMEKYFVSNYEQYLKQLDSIKHLVKITGCNYGGSQVEINYNSLKEKLEKIYNDIKSRNK
jgi:ubiquitin-protein ligase